MDAKPPASRMVKNRPAQNAADLERETGWFRHVIETRMRGWTGGQDTKTTEATSAPKLKKQSSLYASFVQYYKLSEAERLVLVLAMAPFIRPQLLDVFFRTNPATQRGYTEFGGIHGTNHGGFLPTGETALFILAGADLQERFAWQKLFDRDHVFARHNILKLEAAAEGEPFLSGALKISRDILDYLTTGEMHKPDFSPNFPAKLITTQLQWEDLALEKSVLRQIEELRIWLEHSQVLMQDWGLGKRIRPGYRVLFHGPPGTGKTLTSALLGKSTERDVYRIDLSTVVSKYIGETEKNLSKIFDQAQSKGWILFFDEADALFGKRTNVQDAHDKYANQEVSYLLQRIEDFDGVIILASNMKSNLDEAFVRRFESIIHFPIPGAQERKRLWKEAFSPKSKLDKEVNLDFVAENYELSGGAIVNIIRYCSMMAVHRGDNVISRSDLQDGIRREFQKEGRTI